MRSFIDRGDSALMSAATAKEVEVCRDGVRLFLSGSDLSSSASLCQGATHKFVLHRRNRNVHFVQSGIARSYISLSFCIAVKH